MPRWPFETIVRYLRKIGRAFLRLVHSLCLPTCNLLVIKSAPAQTSSTLLSPSPSDFGTPPNTLIQPSIPSILSPALDSLFSRQQLLLASLRCNPFAAATLDASADLSQHLCFDQATLTPYSTGGYSDVYRAILPQGSSEISIAIKVLRSVDVGPSDCSDYSIERRVTQRMVREMRVWRRLEHRRILPLLGYAMLDVLQAGDGLAFLHNSQPAIVHSDLKANNVLIDDTGEAMLSDFGLSKFLGDGPSGLSTSRTGEGAMRWRAPELLDEEPELTTLSDMYSFGWLVLEIMTGRLPFEKHRSLVAIIDAKRTGGIEPADYPELDQNDPLWPVISDCCARTPALRPTADQALVRLQSLQHKTETNKPAL
ncbi:hypothetical protein FRB99_006054 [Tulasnella sp. 403]|nr:hypothetical protein FRB99_006054 [Tulasnella sp. 403]